MKRLLTRLLLTAIVGMAVVAAARQERQSVSGRGVAPTMSVQGAPWLDRAERESEEQPTRAVDALRLKSGMVVADVGAGSGYYTVRLARAVGRTGQVYATDVQPGMLVLIRSRMAREKLGNVTLVQGTGEDPNVPIQPLHKMTVAQIRQELAADGFAIDRVIDVLPWQHIVILKAADQQ